jgi:hypothetical protein
MKTDFRNFTEKECLKYLRENFGLIGYKTNGLTKKPENRTLENMRLECAIQYAIIEHTELSIEELCTHY